jgi:hypothetical protein
MSSNVPYILPVGGAGVGAIEIVADPVKLRVNYTYGAGHEVHKGAIEFDEVIAYRFRDEMHSYGFVSDSYDTVVEVPKSKWRKELLKHEPKEIWGSARDKTHFAVLFSSNGYLEVLASAFEVVAP